MEISRQNFLTIAHGNIFESECHCLINPVNTVGVMGAGLALEFKQRYPHMFKLYKNYCDNGSLRTGNIMFYKERTTSDQIICLFPTKMHWKNPSKLSYIDSGLRAFAKYHKIWKITSVAIPKIGCGRGGLDWDFHVKPLIIKYLHNLPLQIELYE